VQTTLFLSHQIFYPMALFRQILVLGWLLFTLQTCTAQSPAPQDSVHVRGALKAKNVHDTIRYEIRDWRNASDWSTTLSTLEKNFGKGMVWVSGDGVWLYVVRRRQL
jgi:hypothetical protein